MNIIVTLLAGLAIFPAVFSFGFQPNEGPTLLFTVLPAVFEQLPFGTLFFIGFLVAFLFAALTSAFSMVEIIVATIGKGDEKEEKKTVMDERAFDLFGRNPMLLVLWRFE